MLPPQRRSVQRGSGTLPSVVYSTAISLRKKYT